MPDLGLRDWNELTTGEKEKIWFHLRGWFGEEEWQAFMMTRAVDKLNEASKYHSYARHYLLAPSLDSGATDFRRIFFEEEQNVVYQLITLYFKTLLETQREPNLIRTGSETDEEHERNKIDHVYKRFDEAASRVNDVFGQFGLNVEMTRQGLIPRQDQRISDEIYQPVLRVLSGTRWYEVSRELGDAIEAFQNHTPEGYSKCVTLTVSAVEAFLQIVVHGETGKGTLAELIREAQKKGLIPSDNFSGVIFDELKSTFARERKETSDAHVKEDYATEKNARLVLNLAMVFLQHCLQVT